MILVGEGDAIGAVGVLVGVVSPDVAAVFSVVFSDEGSASMGSSNCGREFAQRRGELTAHLVDR